MILLLLLLLLPLLRAMTCLSDIFLNLLMMNHAKNDAVFMHCLPAYRGVEVSSEVIDGSQSVVWSEAENRLHVQKSLLLYLIVA